MDWVNELDQRLSNGSSRAPYEMALAIEGHPLPGGRDVYALADVLGVDPGDLMHSLTEQHGEEKAKELLAQMGKKAAAACGYPA